MWSLACWDKLIFTTVMGRGSSEGGMARMRQDGCRYLNRLREDRLSRRIRARRDSLN